MAIPLLLHIHRACWKRDLDATFLQGIVDQLRHFQLLRKLFPIIIHPHLATHVQGEIAYIQGESLSLDCLRDAIQQSKGDEVVGPYGQTFVLSAPDESWPQLPTKGAMERTR